MSEWVIGCKCCVSKSQRINEFCRRRPGSVLHVCLPNGEHFRPSSTRRRLSHNSAGLSSVLPSAAVSISTPASAVNYWELSIFLLGQLSMKVFRLLSDVHATNRILDKTQRYTKDPSRRSVTIKLGHRRCLLNFGQRQRANIQFQNFKLAKKQ